MVLGAVVPVAVVALVVAGLPAREPAVGAGIEAGVLEGRPAVEVPDGAVPAVTVSDDVRTVVGDDAAAQADRMAHDLVADLMIEADAAGTEDRELAASAVGGPRLESFPDEAATGGVEFDAMEVVLVRDPADPQAVPRFGIHGRGSSGSDAPGPRLRPGGRRRHLAAHGAAGAGLSLRWCSRDSTIRSAIGR